MRQDLLALTVDDLALLANRGLARRAQQEVESDGLSYELAENSEGTVTVTWSDAVSCVLPGGKPASAGRCSCPATTICRHILRSVLAYQRHCAAQASAPLEVGAPWDPGAIDDEAIERLMGRSALVWARRAIAEGQVVELVRAAKPTATLHSLACTVRFLVPGDLSYTRCDCAEAAPCRHVPLAIWAFRRLDPSRASGVVETGTTAPAAPASLLDTLDAMLGELATVGMAGAPQTLSERLRRLEQQCRAAGLIWPADALAELVQAHASYRAHDARFEPLQLVALVGELGVRGDAIRANTGAVPQLFLRGSAADGETSVGAARLVGLGCGAHIRRGGVDLAAYLQDTDTGATVAVLRAHADPADQAAPSLPLWQLAQAPAAAKVSLAALGGGQALIKGGRRLPSARFVPGRAPLTVHPQAYAWEMLRAPLLAEEIRELGARIAAQPPAALRPRRVTDGLHVCAVAQVEAATFVAVEQVVRATLRDAQGGTMTLLHPYHTRAHAGTTALLAALQAHPGELRFVAGHVHLTAAGLIIAPTALVFETGASRWAVQPWIDRAAPGDNETLATPHLSPAHPDPLAAYWAQIEAALGELLVLGVRRPDERLARRWRELARFGGALGFVRLLEPVEHLASELERQQAALGWQPDTAVAAVLQLARLTQLVGGGLGAV